MDSKFISAFENIHFEYRAVTLVFGSTFNNIFIFESTFSSTASSAFENVHLQNGLWNRCSALYQYSTHFEFRAMGQAVSFLLKNQFYLQAAGSAFRSVLNIIHTLKIEIWDQHSPLHSKTFILNIELWNRY